MPGRVSVGGRFIGADASLAAVIWQPPPGTDVRFAALHIPAAFEEMNKARRMVALQARALASAGGCVVVYDPYGTGDSRGEHGEATFARGRADAVDAWSFMRDAFPSVPGVLWGLRLGALMAAGLAGDATLRPSALLLWQPTAAWQTFFNQFLRLAGTAGLTGRGSSGAASGRLVRERLEAGEVVDVAGYEVTSSLVSGDGGLALEAAAAPACPVVWCESSANAPAEPSAIAVKTARRWTSAGTRVDLHAVSGPSFWAAAEIEESPALIDVTTRALVREFGAAGVPA